MASIIFNNSVPGSHAENAQQSQRVSASVQVVNEGNADGFAELVIMGDLSGTSGVQRASRGGGGAYLTVYSNYMTGGGPYRVSVILFEVVNGSRQTILDRHDNFTANIVVQGPRGGWMSQAEADALEREEQARIDREYQARIERENQARIDRENQARIDREEQARIDRQNRDRIEQAQREQAQREQAQREQAQREQAQRDQERRRMQTEEEDEARAMEQERQEQAQREQEQRDQEQRNRVQSEEEDEARAAQQAQREQEQRDRNARDRALTRAEPPSWEGEG